MPCQLVADCLYEILEFLEEDKVTLHSCLLVNHLWCEISVRILWRNIWSFKPVAYKHRSKVQSSILSTLTACLPDESKVLLYNKGIFIPTPTSNPPLFNYASYCKVLLIREISQMLYFFLKKQESIDLLLILEDKIYLVSQEIIKMFMNQIPSLKNLKYCTSYMDIPNNITYNFIHFPGARNCLRDISELSCNTDIKSEFFYQLSQTCHNIQSLTVKFENATVNGLTDLISAQKNLKYLHMTINDFIDWTEITPSLTKHSNSLIQLKIYGRENYGPFTFITIFTNLQELVLSLDAFEELNLQDITYSKLQVLKFPYQSPRFESLIKFLEHNGKNLKKLHLRNSTDNLLDLAIIKFCPNLKSLSTLDCGIELLKLFFNSCKQLESIKIWHGLCLEEKEILEIVAKYSPKNFRELKLYNPFDSGLNSKDLELFFINWKNRIPQKSLSFVLGCLNISEVERENMKVIEKYKKLGIIKQFEIIEK